MTLPSDNNPTAGGEEGGRGSIIISGQAREMIERTAWRSECGNGVGERVFVRSESENGEDGLDQENCKFKNLWVHIFLKYRFIKFITLIKQKYKINNSHYNLEVKQK